MSRGRLGLIVLGAGVLGSQAGHLLTYELRFGSAAGQLQSTGAHAYFPAVARTGLGLASLALLAGLLVAGMARVVGGRSVADLGAPPFLRLLAAIYTLQLALFAIQETVEALLGGSPGGSAPLLLLTGAVGQLPVAVAATLAVRWLLIRVRPALTLLRFRPAVPRLVAAPIVVQFWPPAGAAAAAVEAVDSSVVRGPPSF